MKDDPVREAAERAAEREAAHRRDPEPSLAARLAQIGVLGWATALPILLGLYLGGLLDDAFASGVTFAAAGAMLGGGLGLWSAWRWMERS